MSPVTDTYRVPGRPAALPPAAHVAWLLSLETFADFWQQVEQTHNNVHSWVGGTMDEIPVAAFDPIFWGPPHDDRPDLRTVATEAPGSGDRRFSCNTHERC